MEENMLASSAMEVFLYPFGSVVGIVLSVILWGLLFRKAGFSFWLGLLGIIPFVPFFVLLVTDWPIERRLGATRAETDAASEEDAYALLEQGNRLMRKNQYEDALQIFERIATQWPDSSVGQDARIAIKEVREKLIREAAIRGQS